MKFIAYLDSDVVQGMCIQYKLCTKMCVEEFNSMLKLADSTNNDNLESTIEKIAHLIHDGSNTEMTVFEIAGELYRNTSRFVEDDEPPKKKKRTWKIVVGLSVLPGETL